MSDYNPASDPRSATSLIHGYLASKGLPLTGENVRRALEANAANPGTISSPEGGQLINQGPPGPGAANAAVRSPGGSGIPTPPIPPVFDAPGTTDAGGGGGGPSTTSAAGGGNTSAAPTGAGGGTSGVGGMPTSGELNNALLASAILGSGVGGGILTHVLQNRTPGAPAAAAAAPVVPAVEPPVAGSGFDAQGKPTYSGGARGAPSALPPSVPATVPPAPAPSQPILPPDAFVDPALTRRLNAFTPVPGSEVPPQSVITPDQLRAQNPGTANVPAAEVAPTSPRARARVRAPRVRVPL